MEDIAWRFPDVRKDDVVLAKPFPVMQENVTQLKHCSHVVTVYLTFSSLSAAGTRRESEVLPQEFGESHPELTETTCITWRETETPGVIRGHCTH